MISNLRILKENKKHIILKKKNIIVKKSKSEDDKLKNEYNCINYLRLNSNYLKIKLPEAKIDKNQKKEQPFFYTQDYIKGDSLSYIAKNRISKKKIQEIIKMTHELLDHCLNFNIYSGHSPSKQYKKLIVQEYEILKKKPLIKNLCKKKKLFINNFELENIEVLLNKFFESKEMYQLDKDKEIISKFGHFNFHGENIIINFKKNFFEYRIIDPDSSLNNIDNIFSICRFFYTFDHDTISDNKFLIAGDILGINNSDETKYKCIYTWDKSVISNYKKIFNFNSFFRNQDSNVKFRFFMMYLFCLIRGANVNFDNELKFVDQKKNLFRNKSFFLFLKLILFINGK